MRCFTVAILVLIVPTLVCACLWDYDTLRQERQRFPDTLELITGKFLRHSPEFYEWRAKDRLYKLEGNPTNLAYYDDLAVAYEKTGQHAKAIETILAKENIQPGLYETYSNLGTFHILAGDLELGLPYIDKALAINPDAHFGRERYQKWLVEYALTRKEDGKIVFPLRRSAEWAKTKEAASTFPEFLQRRSGANEFTPQESEKAVKGVLGMMRFANHDNPLLLEALGDLLYSQYRRGSDAKLLAARAYLKASYAVQDKAAQHEYRELAQGALAMKMHPNTHDHLKLTDLETEFATELSDAEQWYAALKQKEIGWIAEGKDADVEFDRLYTEEPVALDLEPPDRTWIGREAVAVLLLAVAGCALLVLLAFLVVRGTRKLVKSGS
jgi:hypothetical protein